MTMLPKDSVMLLSFLNLKLRDFYPSLDAFCEDTGEDKGIIENKLRELGYHYNADLNQFV